MRIEYLKWGKNDDFINLYYKWKTSEIWTYRNGTIDKSDKECINILTLSTIGKIFKDYTSGRLGTYSIWSRKF